MKPRVFSMGPLGSVVAIDDQGRPIVHANDCFGKRKSGGLDRPRFVTSLCRA